MSPPAWSPWVHPDVAARLCADPAPASGRWWREDAVALFVDVSGFTPMAEALGALGPVGAEALTRALNTLFEPLVGQLAAWGGRIARFAGDSVTVTFPCGSDPGAAALAALGAAHAAQRVVRELAALPTPAGAFPIGLKCGLDAGPILVGVGGGPDRLDVMVAGPPIDGAAEAEHHARPGDVVASAAVAALVPGLAGEDAGDGHLRVVSLPPDAVPIGVAVTPTGDHADGWRFLHPVVAARVRAGQERFLGEHRPVTVVFARLPPLPVEPDVLARVLTGIVALLGRFDATLDKVDCGDKGTKVIALFGAPLAHPDDADRAIACALALADELGAGVGVHRGMTFCGPVGSVARREYTAMGEVVNLAARLMQAADRGVLASASALEVVGRRYDTTALPPRPMKGFRDPLPLWRIEGARRGRFEAAGGAGIVGRAAELAQAAEAFAGALAGRGRVLLWVGDAGIGKSRLAEEVVDRAIAAGLEVHAGVADDRLKDHSLHAWRDVWTGVFGTPAALAARLATLGHAAAAPIVSEAIGWSAPAAGVVSAADARARAVRDALAAVAETDPTPRLLVLDDAHWLDADSRALLASLARRLARSRWSIAVFSRSAAQDSAPELPPLRHVSVTRLAPLSTAETGDLVARHLGVPDVSGSVAERVLGQTGGNPLHVAELVAFARARNLDLATVRDDVLPASVRVLVSARLDALDETDRTVLKAAAVVGMRFDPDLVAAYFPEVGSAAAVRARLDALEREGLVESRDAERGFRHRLTRQVVYEGLSVSARSELHARLSDHLAAGATPDAWTVAHHAVQSGDPARIRVRVPPAARHASATGAHDDAARWWTALLGLAEVADRDDVRLALADARTEGARWEAALAAYTEAVAVARASGDRGRELAGHRGIADVHLRRGAPLEAAPHGVRAAELAEALGDDTSRFQAASTAYQVAWSAGRLDDARAAIEGVLPRAEALGHAMLGPLLMRLGVTFRTADPERAVALHTRALALADAAGELGDAARAAGNLGLALQQLRRIDEAQDAAERSVALVRRTADLRGLATAIGNVGVMRSATGDVGGALACTVAQIERQFELDDARGLAIGLCNLAVLLMTTGRTGLARRALDAGLGLFAARGMASVGASWHHSDIRLLEHDGRPADALAAIEALVAGGTAVNEDVAYIRARLAVRLGRPAELPPELAATAFGAWCLAPDDPERRAAAIRELHAAWTPANWRVEGRLASLAAPPPPVRARPLPDGVAGDPDVSLLLERLHGAGLLG